MNHMEPLNLPICNQCNTMHPPLPTGTKCPMAIEKTQTGEIIKYDDFFISLKNILTSQIQNKKINDTKKFLGNILVIIAKISEEYKEQ